MKGEGTPAPGDERAALRERAAKGVFWTATGNWANELARLVVFAVLARLLDPAAFGLAALALVFIGFTQVIADQGLADALVQRKRLDPLHLDSAFWMSMAFGLLLTLLLMALAVPLALLFDQAELAPVLMVLALVMPIQSASLVQRAILTRAMAFRSLALRTMVAIAAGGVAGIGAALLGFGVWSLVAQQIVAALAALVVLWSVSDWRPRFAFSRDRFGELVGFGGHVVGFRLLNYFTRRVDELLIGAFLGPASLGLYTIAYRMLRLLYQVTSSLIDKVSFPLFSRLQDEPPRLRRAFYKSSAFAAVLAFPAFVTMVVLAPEIVRVLFGPKWTEAVPVMQVLSVLGVVQILSYLNGTLVKALGKPSWQLVIVFATAVLKIPAFLLAVQYGIVGVAVAATCVGYLAAPAYYVAVRRLLSINAGRYLGHLWGPIAASAFAAVIMLVLQQLLDARALTTLVLAGGSGLLGYLLALQLLARPLADEARQLVRRGLPTVRPVPATLRPSRR